LKSGIENWIDKGGEKGNSKNFMQKKKKKKKKKNSTANYLLTDETQESRLNLIFKFDIIRIYGTLISVFAFFL